MASNVSCTDNELIEVNNAIYGAARLQMVQPYVMQIAGNDQNYGGTLRHESRKKIIYDLVQKFPDTEIAELFTATSTEKKQANVKSDFFEYLRRAFLVEIQYSNLEPHADKTNPRARMVQELFKQYDFSSYNGMFGNVGVANNPNTIKQTAVAGQDLQKIIAAINKNLNVMKDLGWNSNNMNQITIGLTAGVMDKLASVGANREKSDYVLLMEAFQGANFIQMQKYLDITPQPVERVELNLRPLITHHHATLPSLYKDYEALDGLTHHDIFSFETSAIELEEKGAIISQPLTLS